MAVKTVGAEWSRFYSDKEAWPEGAWHEDEDVTVNGARPGDDFDFSEVPNEAQMTISGGIVFMKSDDDDGPSLEVHFKRWRKRQTTTVLIVEVPHERADAVRSAIKDAGGTVKA